MKISRYREVFLVFAPETGAFSSAVWRWNFYDLPANASAFWILKFNTFARYCKVYEYFRKGKKERVRGGRRRPQKSP